MFSADIWAVSGWVFGSTSIGEYNFGIPEYSALIALSTGGIVAINIAYFRSLLPRERFHRLSADILRLIEDHDQLGDRFISRTTHAKALAITRELKRLRIQWPNPPQERSEYMVGVASLSLWFLL